MRKLTKLFAVLLCLTMMTAGISVVALAANGATNVVLSSVPTEVNVGDTVTITLSFNDMKAATLLCGVRFDNTLLECTSIVGPLGEEDPGYFFVERKERPKEVEAIVSNLTQANTNS